MCRAERTVKYLWSMIDSSYRDIDSSRCFVGYRNSWFSYTVMWPSRDVLCRMCVWNTCNYTLWDVTGNRIMLLSRNLRRPIHSVIACTWPLPNKRSQFLLLLYTPSWQLWKWWQNNFLVFMFIFSRSEPLNSFCFTATCNCKVHGAF